MPILYHPALKKCCLIPILIALAVCLIPTTIGIAGMDRVLRSNVIAMSGRAVEAAGGVDVLLLA